MNLCRSFHYSCLQRTSYILCTLWVFKRTFLWLWTWRSIYLTKVAYVDISRIWPCLSSPYHQHSGEKKKTKKQNQKKPVTSWIDHCSRLLHCPPSLFLIWSDFSTSACMILLKCEMMQLLCLKASPGFWCYSVKAEVLTMASRPYPMWLLTSLPILLSLALLWASGHFCHFLDMPCLSLNLIFSLFRMPFLEIIVWLASSLPLNPYSKIFSDILPGYPT